MSSAARTATTKVVVATTVMLSFISYWGASAIVLGDLAGSAYYACGIAETFVGKTAPWFILAIMLFSYAVRALYIESCSLFVRGGVYRVVQEAMGGTMAKIAVSALLFDYMLTGPVSAVSAGLYLAGLVNDTAKGVGSSWQVNPRIFATGFGVLMVMYFWRKNIIGIHESAQKALRIIQLTTLMSVALIVWCVITILIRGFQPVPLPTPSNIHFGPNALGWLKGSWLSSIGPLMIFIGLGHSVLAMSGEETLAQVNREIASPRLTNLVRTGFVVFIYSAVLVSVVSFFAVMLIPDDARKNFLDNIIGGLAMYVAGPQWAKLLFHAFVVFVGTVLLAGGINTSMVGSNGVLNRVAEDGVMPDWFRDPHPKYGTTHRIINTIAGLQVLTVLASLGNVDTLGEAFAFGVMWSFTLKSLGVLVLRYKLPEGRGWRFPLNFRWGSTEVPLGIILTTIALFLMAIVNLFTKKIATISGVSFTAAFFLVFLLTERRYKARHAQAEKEIEKFRVEVTDAVTPEVSAVRPGNILVGVRNPNRMQHLEYVLEETDVDETDVIVVNVKHTGQPEFGEWEPTADEVFSDDVAKLFSIVVKVAEHAGKHVELMVVPGRNYNDALSETAQRLSSDSVVLGISGKMGPDAQAKAFGDAWERLPKPRPRLELEIVDPRREEPHWYQLGPHPPGLYPDDLELLHRLWLEITNRGLGPKVHHRDVARVALRRLDRELRAPDPQHVLNEIRREVERHGRRPAA